MSENTLTKVITDAALNWTRNETGASDGLVRGIGGSFDEMMFGIFWGHF